MPGVALVSYVLTRQMRGQSNEHDGHGNSAARGYPKSPAACVKFTYRAANAIQFARKTSRIEPRCVHIRSKHLKSSQFTLTRFKARFYRFRTRKRRFRRKRRWNSPPNNNLEGRKWRRKWSEPRYIGRGFGAAKRHGRCLGCERRAALTASSPQDALRILSPRFQIANIVET